MALAAYAEENNVAHLTQTQLQISKKMVVMLFPVEEITQYLKRQRHFLIVIPNI